MNIALRGFAALIDLLQFLFFIVFLGLATLTPVGGGAVGGIAGATICWNASGNVVSGAINAAYCAVVGAGVGALAGPIGIVIDVAISSTFGVLLIIALALSGRFSLFPVTLGFIGEMTPGVNAFVPAWSILVHRCIKQYKKSHKGAATTQNAFSIITGTLGAGAPSLPGMATQRAQNRYAPAGTTSAAASPMASRALLRQAKSFDGIRKPTGSSVLKPSYAHIA
ncbi:MAG TPA: hypothetical protein VJJ20_02425 [Candidatus Paceibacterota bacterium]